LILFFSSFLLAFLTFVFVFVFENVYITRRALCG
jgi:hypothetical protein